MATAGACTNTSEIASVPAFSGTNFLHGVFVETIFFPEGSRAGLDDCIDFGNAIAADCGCKLGTSGRVALEEVFLPEGTSTENALAATFHSQFDLTLVLWIIDTCREQNPRCH